MNPMDIFSTFAGKAAAGALTLAVLAMGVSSLMSPSDDDVSASSPSSSSAESGPVIRNDSYVLSLNIRNEGINSGKSHYLTEGSKQEHYNKWRFGPTDFSVRLVNMDGSSDIGYGHTMHGLDEWAERIESFNQNTKINDYQLYAKEMQRVLKEAKALQADVEMLVRVLDGIQTYTYRDKKDDAWVLEEDPGHKMSELPHMRFDGASAANYDSTRREGLPNPEEYSLPAWSPVGEEDENDLKGIARHMELLAWHYDPADIKRIRELLKDADLYEGKLTLDMSAFDSKEREDFILKSTADGMRASFYNSFMLGLLEIARAAWWLSPNEQPDSFWAKAPDDLHPVYASINSSEHGQRLHANASARVDLQDFPFPKKGKALSLPEMPDDGLVGFYMPLRGIEKRDYPFWHSRHNDRFQYISHYTLQNEYDGMETYKLSSANKVRHDFMRLNEDGQKDYVHSRSAIFTAPNKGRASGELSVVNIYNKEYLSSNEEVEYFDHFRDAYSIGWVVQREGPLCVEAECFPQEEKENSEYQPPPVIAVEAKTYPETPVPGEPALIGFRVQNNGDIIASALTLELKILDALMSKAPEDLEPATDLCKKTGPAGRFTCGFGDLPPGAVADILFDAKTPSGGQFMWLADLDSKGDLGGLKEHGGIEGEPVKPKILEVVVIDRQTEFEDSVPVTPYPYGPSGDGDFTRNLFIVGENLPKEKGDISFNDGGELKYFWEAFEDTNNKDHQEIISRGWMKYYDLDDATAARAKAKKDGLTGILVDTRIASKTIMPGTKTLYMNGIPGEWELQFGDIAADIYFVRPIENEPFDLLANAYAPSRIYLVLQTNMALPIDSIPLELDLSKSGIADAKKQTITVSRKGYLDKTMYISEPLDIHNQNQKPSLENGISVPVSISKNGPALLRAYVDEVFAAKSFHLAKPVTEGAVQIWTSPASQETSWLWRDALRRAAACHSDLKDKNLETAGAEEADEIWNWIILTTSDHFPGQSVKLGQHAATLLLRDMYLKLASGKDDSEASKFKSILSSDLALDGYLNMMRSKFYDSKNPILRMKVPAIDQGEIAYKYVVMNDDEWLAERYSLSVDEIKKTQTQGNQSRYRSADKRQ